MAISDKDFTLPKGLIFVDILGLWYTKKGHSYKTILLNLLMCTFKTGSGMGAIPSPYEYNLKSFDIQNSGRGESFRNYYA